MLRNLIKEETMSKYNMYSVLICINCVYRSVWHSCQIPIPEIPNRTPFNAMYVCMYI